MKLKIFILSVLMFAISNVFASGFMPVANISKIHGKAFFKKEALKKGMEIYEGMEVNIPKKGDFIEVKFQNGHLVRFSGATFTVTTLNPKVTLLQLAKGKIYSMIKSLTQDESFEVKTSKASFAVRGTQFMVEESKDKSYLCVCEGIVVSRNEKGEMDVKKDEDLVVLSSSSELVAQKASKQMFNSTKKVFNVMKN